jgi:hypothetical protein
MIFDFFNEMNKKFTKKYQKLVYKKYFNIFKKFIIFDTFFNQDNDNNNKTNIKLLNIINKMFNSIFIDNKGLIKLDKHLFGLVEKFNVIIKKKYMKGKKNVDKNILDNNCCDTSSDNSDK